jgi:hypothetical protein
MRTEFAAKGDSAIGDSAIEGPAAGAAGGSRPQDFFRLVFFVVF